MVTLDDLAGPDDGPAAASAVQTIRERRAAEAETRRIAAERQAFWVAVLSSDIGRREIYGILRENGAFEAIFGVGPSGIPQPEASWYNAGRRDTVQRLFFTLQRYAYHQTFQMMAEHDPRFKASTTQAGAITEDDGGEQVNDR